ncbi:MAG: transcriptional regulator [Tannerellaceae bacterium]|jgi:DNA-binding MarR family transcriptional regulator|nr:transcriptional regulator [Tannerellaceae bacterium]
MKDKLLATFDKTLENRIRLGIMSILYVNRSADFTTLRDTLEITDGNLASHIKALTAAGYISTAKFSAGRNSNTVYSITDLGRMQFQTHLNALEQILQNMEHKH